MHLGRGTAAAVCQAVVHSGWPSSPRPHPAAVSRSHRFASTESDFGVSDRTVEEQLKNDNAITDIPIAAVLILKIDFIVLVLKLFIGA